jgi:hypothetical protein
MKVFLPVTLFWRIASQGQKHENRGLGMPVGQRLLKANAIVTLTMVTQLAIASALGDSQIGSKKDLGAALEKAVQCDNKDWERVMSALAADEKTAGQLGIAEIQDTSMETDYELSPGIKVFGLDAAKVAMLTAGTDFFWVYLAGNSSDSGKLAKRLHMHAYPPDSIAVEQEDIPCPLYYKKISEGRRQKGGSFVGESESAELGTVVSHGQRLLVIGCSYYSGDRG